jgi:hypothetical protein
MRVCQHQETPERQIAHPALLRPPATLKHQPRVCAPDAEGDVPQRMMQFYCLNAPRYFCWFLVRASFPLVVFSTHPLSTKRTSARATFNS